VSILISAGDLAARVHDRQGRVVLLDVRWRLGGPPGLDEYRHGHIPGAVYVDLETELADPAQPSLGRHPLPSPARLRSAVRRWGVRRGDTVVAYDDSGNLASARAWWLLRWAGVDDVLLLDGGLGAWVDAGLGLAVGDETTEPGDVEIAPGRLPTLDLDEVAAFASSGVLLDARAVERYRGEVEPVDPRAGHIPGALSAPTTANLDSTGRFRPAGELRQRFVQLGVDAQRPTAVYCGSGVTAAHEIAALAIAGFDAVLFPGSWSQWSNADGARVATGSA